VGVLQLLPPGSLFRGADAGDKAEQSAWHAVPLGWQLSIILPACPTAWRSAGARYGRSPWVHTLLTLGTPHQSIEAYPFGRATVRSTATASATPDASNGCGIRPWARPCSGTSLPSERLPTLFFLLPPLQETLTGPHLAKAPPAVSGSSLRFANHFYPDAASLGSVRLVCACGDAIHGQPLWGDGSSDGSSSVAKHSRWDCYFAYEGYKARGAAAICCGNVANSCHAGYQGLHLRLSSNVGSSAAPTPQLECTWMQLIAADPPPPSLCSVALCSRGAAAAMWTATA
jgi:hypothetical protein